MRALRLVPVLAAMALAAGLGAAAPGPPPGAPRADGAYQPSPEAARRLRFQALHASLDPLEGAGIGEREPGTHRPWRKLGPIGLNFPVVLAHGAVWAEALGRGESSGPAYWKGVVEHFETLGVEVLAPRVPPASSVEARARALKAAIDAAFPDRPVHVLAHSMGGLDARWMISRLDMAERVLTLTTLGTPHRGSWFADFVVRAVGREAGIEKLSQRLTADVQALEQLTVAAMNRFNPAVPDHPRVAYFSYAGEAHLWDLPAAEWGPKLVVLAAEREAVGRGVGTATRAALEGLAPGAFRRIQGLVKSRDVAPWIGYKEAGSSDGVVSVSSARWGEYLGSFRASHTAQIGQGGKVDHRALWETMARNLAALGY